MVQLYIIWLTQFENPREDLPLYVPLISCAGSAMRTVTKLKPGRGSILPKNMSGRRFLHHVFSREIRKFSKFFDRAQIFRVASSHRYKPRDTGEDHGTFYENFSS